MMKSQIKISFAVKTQINYMPFSRKFLYFYINMFLCDSDAFWEHPNYLSHAKYLAITQIICDMPKDLSSKLFVP